MSPKQADQVAAVYACITAITESFAMIPAKVVEKDNGKFREDADHPLHGLLTVSPNGFMDCFNYKEAGQLSLLQYGDAFSRVERYRSGEVKALFPLLPERVKTDLNKRSPGLSYFFRDEPESSEKELAQRDVFHIRNRARDGINGTAPIEGASQTVQFARALLTHGVNLFENGAFQSGFVEVPHAFKDEEARDNFMKAFRKFFGAKNAGKAALLEQGAKFIPLDQKARDAQFIESKQFSTLEIARIFRVPPHMIQDLSQGASYSSIEQQSINFVQYTIQPWVTRWEAALKFQLLNAKSEKNHFVRFDIEELIRGDLKSRTEAIVSQLKYGLASINEGRTKLDMNPTEDEVGDMIFVDQNMKPASQVINPEPEEEEQGDQEEEQPTQGETSEEEAERFRPLLVDALRRVRNREIAFFSSNKATEPEELSGFLDRHADFVFEKLEPVFLAAGSNDGRKLAAFSEDYSSDFRGFILNQSTDGAVPALEGRSLAINRAIEVLRWD